MDITDLTQKWVYCGKEQSPIVISLTASKTKANKDRNLELMAWRWSVPYCRYHHWDYQRYHLLVSFFFLTPSTIFIEGNSDEGWKWGSWRVGKWWGREARMVAGQESRVPCLPLPYFLFFFKGNILAQTWNGITTKIKGRLSKQFWHFVTVQTYSPLEHIPCEAQERVQSLERLRDVV